MKANSAYMPSEHYASCSLNSTAASIVLHPEKGGGFSFAAMAGSFQGLSFVVRLNLFLELGLAQMESNPTAQFHDLFPKGFNGL